MTTLTRKRGDTFADEIAVTDSAGTAINLTGYTFAMTIDPSPSPVDASGNIYSVSGTITDAASGLVEFAPSAVQTDIVGQYFYDIQMTDAAGRLRTIQSGTYNFTQDITK